MTARRRLSAGRSASAAALAALLLGALAASPAEATMVISSQTTKNVSCKNGVCTATRHFAVLNAGDLAGMLAAGDVTVVPGTRALDIDIKVPLSWASASRLTLDAYHSILIDRTLTVTGSGALTMTTNDGGSGGDLFFNGMGRAIFWDLASSLIINGTAYTLVGDIATLASGIAAHPTHSFALANNYDAGVDGTYGSSPIPTTFFGKFDGLGNTISNLTMSTSSGPLALFLDARNRLADIRMTHAHAANTSANPGSTAILAVSGRLMIGDTVTGTVSAACCDAAGLVASMNSGTVTRSWANVRITGTANNAGGLVGEAGNGAFIMFSHADGDVTGANNVGGLVGLTGFIGADAAITQDFATGKVSGAIAGGLIGYSEGHAQNSYATGAVSGGTVGGFLGRNDFYWPDRNYAIGHVEGTSLAGGFSGCNQTNETDNYWDTDTAGVTLADGGNCSDGGDLPVGLTTAQFQSGLPNGFDPAIWAEDPSINNGFPYLIANPPQ